VTFHRLITRGLVTWLKHVETMAFPPPRLVSINSGMLSTGRSFWLEAVREIRHNKQNSHPPAFKRSPSGIWAWSKLIGLWKSYSHALYHGQKNDVYNWFWGSKMSLAQ
jgi:hypothetical protein